MDNNQRQKRIITANAKLHWKEIYDPKKPTSTPLTKWLLQITQQRGIQSIICNICQPIINCDESSTIYNSYTMTKYVVDSAETHYQPGSNESVMLNKLGVTSVEEINDVESIMLARLYEKVFSEDAIDTPLTFETIATWHRWWLANIYDWAGKIRNVNMSKADFLFTAPSQIPKLLDNFELEFLSKFSSLPEFTINELVSYIARSHIEFILIHPFREGNGRISRLLIDVLCHHAGYGLLDYTLWDKHKDFYIASIQAGVGLDYQHMERLVRDILIS